MMNKRLMLLSAVTAVLAANAATLPERIVAFDTIMSRPASGSLANQALSPLRHQVSLSHVAAGYDRMRLGGAPVSYNGDGGAEGFFRASTYLKTTASTITGHASYTNGKTYGTEGCEVADPASVYPYFTADETGGDFRRETYSFGGSYASAFGSGWHWGAGLSYTAIQAYRKSDPRPKNTVGTLDFSAGIGHDFLGNVIAAGFDATKYKQSNDIMFVSELGESKIYHATGLGTHYTRFAGTSKSAYYNGWRRGVSVSLAPASSRGAFASASWHRYTLDKVLTDLNHLPLNSIGENSYAVQGGWQSDRVALSGRFDAARRIGKENIFGDPAGNVYPDLATYPAFRRDILAAGLMAAGRPVLSASRRLDLWASADWDRTAESHISSTASRSSRICAVSFAAGAEWVSAISRAVIIHASASGAVRTPFDCSLDGIDPTGFFLDRLALRDYEFASHNSVNAAVSAGADWVLPRFCTLGLRVAYRHEHHSPAIGGNGFETSLNITF